MDHLTQIPQVGREWEDFPEAYSALGFLAGRTTNSALGALVTNVGLRNPALLAKMLATIDVLSGGRAFCGLGAGWFEAEQVAYGYEFEPTQVAGSTDWRTLLRILPLMWGPGKATLSGQGRIRSSKPFAIRGRSAGSRSSWGPRLAGPSRWPAQVRRWPQRRRAPRIFASTSISFEKCAEEAGRDPDSLEVSVLDTPLLGTDRADVAALVEANRGTAGASVFAASHNAGTVSDHVERLRLLAGSGVGAVYVSPVGLNSPEEVAAWKPVIEALA